MKVLELYETNLPLVTSRLKLYTSNMTQWSVNYHIDDMRQEASLSLYNACKKYDPSKGFAFSTYAVCCIDGAIKMYLERLNRSRRKNKTSTVAISLDTEVVGYDDVKLEDTIPAPEKEDVLWIFTDTRLDDRMRLICKLIYEGYTQTEIGKRIGISQVHVSRIITSIKTILLEDYCG